MLTSERLTSEGAARLRAVRERYRTQPEAYTNHTWVCGSQGCIAGWLCTDAGAIASADMVSADTWCPRVAARLLGLPFEFGTSLSGLFTMSHHSPETAIAAIDAFLWEHGYPPEPLDEHVAGAIVVSQAPAQAAR